MKAVQFRSLTFFDLIQTTFLTI